MSLRIGADESAGLLLGAGQDLIVATSGAKHGEPFAAEAMREPEGLGDVRGCCRGGKVDGLGDAAVTMTLEGRLHSHVMRRRHVVGRNEELSQ